MEWRIIWYLRLFVENHEAQQVSEVLRPEGIPLQHDHIECGLDHDKFQQFVLTCGMKKLTLRTSFFGKGWNFLQEAEWVACNS